MTLSNRFPIDPRYDSTWSSHEEYIEGLYRIFLSDLVRHPLHWKRDGLQVSLRRHPEVEGRHAVFWHIISGRTGAETSRHIESQRCVRIRWVRKLIELFNREFPKEEEIRWWVDTRRVSRPRYVITRPEFDYVVVVEERHKYALLVTAYYIEYAHRRRKLQREHDNYWQKQEPPTGWTAPDTPSTPG